MAEPDDWPATTPAGAAGDGAAAPARIQVLLATFNGRQWLAEQLDSILGQQGVEIQVLVSDDGSTDGTLALLQARASRDRRIVLLSHSQRFGNAASNFYYLLSEADTQGFAYFAFADQDDIWAPDKLCRHVALLHRTGASGISSDVLAFWPNGRTKLVEKSQPQRRWDHLLEPPGPGCTFLMTRDLVTEVVRCIADLGAAGLGPLPKHDWFIYLVARCSGRRWHIDATATVRYRQHAANEVGANAGLRAKGRRVAVLVRGGYHQMVRQAIQIARRVCAHHHQPVPPEHLHAMTLLRQGRRRRHEALFLALFSLGRL